MKVQILIATMFRSDLSFLQTMKVRDNFVVVNQTDFSKFPDLEFETPSQIVVSTEERGLSKSRNRSLELASGDICVVADDDVTYNENYEEIINESYSLIPDADIIIFDYETDDKSRVATALGSKIRKLNFLDLLKVNSVRITFKYESVKDSCVSFNTYFGTGSTFTSGEESLFLKDCFQKGLNIYYMPKSICFVDFGNSSWFSGFNAGYFETRGAFGKAYFGFFSFLYLIQFLIRKFKFYRVEFSIIDAYRSFKIGEKKFLKIKRDAKTFS